MRFLETTIAGVRILETEPVSDERGTFQRIFCAEEFSKNGLNFQPVQESHSTTRRSGTLRGMHFQRTPHQEQKLIRCLRGTVHDVALDLRKDSPTFGTSLGITLSEDNGRAVFLPGGIAHGFLTLCDDCVLHYAMDVSYVALAALGIRWNDPSFSIDWPMEPTLISKSDQNWPDYER